MFLFRCVFYQCSIYLCSICLLKYSSAASYCKLPLGSVTFGGSGGIHCPPVGGRVHAQGAAGLRREGVRRVVRSRATIHYPQVSGKAARGRPDRIKQRSSG